MDLNDCFEKGLVKKIPKNLELIKSPIKMAKINEKTINTANLTSENISSYITLAYDSLRQILEAICILKGYKVLSHICIGELLDRKLDDFDYIEFDRLRWIRNSISYYGNEVEFNQGKEIIKKMLKMKSNLISKYLRGAI